MYIAKWTNWCFSTVVLEKTLESPLDCKKIQPVLPKDQSRVFIGRTDAEAETPILWPPDVKSWLIWKDPDAGKDWGQEEKGITEDEIVEYHHWHSGQEFEQTPGDSEGQGSLVCCSSWGHKELATTEWLNWTEVKEAIWKDYTLCNTTIWHSGKSKTMQTVKSLVVSSGRLRGRNE